MHCGYAGRTRCMRIFGAVEIAGTKWRGKTWAARAHTDSNSNPKVSKIRKRFFRCGSRCRSADKEVGEMLCGAGSRGGFRSKVRIPGFPISDNKCSSRCVNIVGDGIG